MDDSLFIERQTVCHPTFYHVFLHRLVQVYPAEDYPVAAPPSVAAAGAEAGPFGVAAGIAAAWPVLEIAVSPFEFVADIAEAGPLWIEVGIAAAWPVLEIAAQPFVIVADIAEAGPVGVAVGIAEAGPLWIATGVSNPGRPTFAASPNTGSFPRCSSSAEAVAEVFAGSSTDILPSDDSYNHSSSRTVWWNKKMGHSDSRPNRNYSAVNDTSVPATAATTNR
jgi:hypothetical protein